MRVTLRNSAAALTCVAFSMIVAGCGGAGSAGSGAPPTQSGISTPSPSSDAWPTFGADYTHSSTANAIATGITKSSVSQLGLRWERSLGEAVFSTPVAYGGLLIVVTHNTGTVYALDASTGNIVWTKTLGGQVRMTPTIADGMVFVGTHLFTQSPAGDYYPAPSDFYALDLKTGAQLWTVHLDGMVRSSPVVANGKVFVGVSGGDVPTCLQGGVVALDELSGTLAWAWYVDPRQGQGGSVWSPLAYDGSHLIFGTGNTCEQPVSTANGIVALNLNGSLAWNFVSANSLTDDDTGAGALLHGGTAYIINKNGTLYAINEFTGALQWSKYLGAPDSYGGFATPSTDGSTLFVATATAAANTTASAAVKNPFLRQPLSAVPAGAPQGILYALDMKGAVKWSIESQAQMASYVAIDGNVAFANLDNKVEALDIASGAVLWSYAADSLINAGPIVVPSGVYTVDSDGDVYAFGLPSN